jgi:hypothetical protein
MFFLIMHFFISIISLLDKTKYRNWHGQHFLFTNLVNFSLNYESTLWKKQIVIV